MALFGGALAAAKGGAPGESTITFSRYVGQGTGHVFAMAPDGSQVEQITFGAGVQAHSALSPDGTRIAFSQVDATGSSISAVRGDGGAVVTLNRGSDWSLVPSWSPDGTRIAFTGDADGNWEIYTMASDGSDVRQLTFTDPPVQHVGPKYSPDGALLLYAMSEDGQDPSAPQDLWVMPSVGGTPTRLTHGLDNRESRGWSPDGRRIVVQTVIDGVGQLLVLNADGSGGRQITHYPADTPSFVPGGIFPAMRGAVTPAWSPDGAWIAFAANPDGDYDVYRVRPDGSGLTRITRTPTPELSISWGPPREG